MGFRQFIALQILQHLFNAYGGRVETAGQDVETLLGEEPPNPKEEWIRLKGWYKAAVNRAPPPA